MGEERSELEASYDRVAEQYADEYFNELERKPFDREMLDEFARAVGVQARVCEIGCGPGQVASYLRDRGVAMCGIDLSRQMVTCARRLNPDISFEQGDMLALDLPDTSLGGIVSFYSIIHLKREDVLLALKEMCRVLEPGGRLMLAFHRGNGELHRDDWYGKPVSIDVILLERDEMAGYMEAAGLEVERILERSPYEFEYPTSRIYAFGRKSPRERITEGSNPQA